MDIDLVESIVTPHLVCRAVHSFRAYKAAGTDEIFPAMLTNALKPKSIKGVPY